VTKELEGQNIITIAVTGHRDIPLCHYESLKIRIKQIIDSILKIYINEEIVLLSPLADGADRIVTDVVVNDYSEQIDVRALFPFDEETYKTTFAGGLEEITKEESISAYNHLIAQISKFIFLPFDKIKYDVSTADTKRQLRKEQYSLLGEYIVQHSDVLIVLCDKNSKGKKGGTNEVLNKKLKHAQKSTIYMLSTPRVGHSLPTDLYKIEEIEVHHENI